MATPMTLAQMEAQFRKWGVPFRTNPDAGTWSRTAPGWPWGPVYGSMVHHTGDDAPDDADEKVIHDGRVGLSGPLAHMGGRDNGWFDIVSCGRANHAGGGDPAVLQAVIDESYTDYPPAPRFHEGMAGQMDGNTHFYGTENYYSGSHTPANYHAQVRQQAAICDFHRKDGWSAKSVIGHKEWSDWKVDPGQVDMKTFRADIQWCLDNGPAAAAARFPISGATAPTITPTDVPKEDDMTPEQLSGAPILIGYEKMADGKTDDKSKPVYWDLGHVFANLRAANTATQTMVGEVKALSAGVAAAIATLGAQAQEAYQKAYDGARQGVQDEITGADVQVNLTTGGAA